MAGQVQGKVALVTGGASGIGAACSELLAREGASVVVTDVDELKGPEVVAAHQESRQRGDVPASGRHQRAALDRGRGRNHEALRPARRAGFQCRHRHWGAVDHGDVAGGLAAADRDQSRRRVPVGEALPAGDAQDPRRLRHHDVVAGGPARLGQCYPAIARPRAACGCLRKRSRWNAPRSATASASTRCIPGSSTRRSGARSRRARRRSGQNAPIDPEERAKFATPLARAGHAMDIAKGVLYLASDASSYVTGTELVIDGGMNAGGVVRPRDRPS